MHLRRLLPLVLFLLVFPTSAAVWNQPGDSDPWPRYNSTVADAAVYRHENLRQLVPLNFDPVTLTTTVTTLTNYDYPPGVQSVPQEVWATAFPEVQQKCKAFTEKDLALRLRQLLGLQPDAKKKFFVTMTVRSSDIFRPTTNPITTTEWPCSDPSRDQTCGELFPASVSTDHIKWIANQMLTSYVIAATHDPSHSYPWTRLGYTYDWKPGADRYGASEYVIRAGSVVNVTDKKAIQEYCGRTELP